MSLHRLSAGTGYQYLLRSVAAGDTASPAGQAGSRLSAYYAASGTPPGRWYGTGLAALGGGSAGRIGAGDVVTEEQLAALYGTGRDPVTGEPLGRGYQVYASVEQRIARRIAALPADLDPAERATRVAAIREREEARPVPQPVAGFDLTFTATKSVSVLWALADAATREVVVAAHHAAVADTIAYLERTAAYTRTGKAGAAQVKARGLVVAAFDHWDTRSGDPNLHTHAVIANRVQGPDGAWRSLDSRALHHVAVAASELYDSLLADHLTRALPVSFAWRYRGERRSPAYELDGINDDLLSVFSSRSHDIDTALRELYAGFRARTGREPTRSEVMQLRQQATLVTRPDKQHHRLVDLLDSWLARAEDATGKPADALAGGEVGRALTTRVLRHDEILDNTLTTLTGDVLAGCLERRSTWTIANIHAEISRATRDLRLASTGDRLALLDRLTERVLVRSVPLFDSPTHTSGRDAARVPRVTERRWSHRSLLAAEYRLLQTNNTPSRTAPCAPEATACECATRPRRDRAGKPFALAPDQVDAVIGIATSPLHLDVLVGPAGTGKTTTLHVLAEAWTIAHGTGSVTGLATSATAADLLAQALGIGCDTTAKWVHETSKAEPAPEWRMRPRQLVILDEASLTGTLTLDTLRAQAVAAGAKLLLVGDHRQLAAIEAGGAFGLLARHGSTIHTLTSLWRFRTRWEANATRALRAGNTDCLDAYQANGRIHAGPGEAMQDAAYEAWRTDTTAGRSSLLVAADRNTMTALNSRAHADRVAVGQVTGPTIDLGDISSGGHRGNAGVGDLVLTRRNDRTLTCAGGFVRNGQQWTITALHPDGSVTVAPSDAAMPDDRVRLPADYVRQHLDPGYAITLHRAQGVTVETAHLLATPDIGRRGLYVGMTRGREANHLYLATDQPATCDHTDATPAGTVHGLLAGILADDRTEHSALETHAGTVGWPQAISTAAATDATSGAGAELTQKPHMAREPEPC